MGRKSWVNISHSISPGEPGRLNMGAKISAVPGGTSPIRGGYPGLSSGATFSRPRSASSGQALRDWVQSSHAGSEARPIQKGEFSRSLFTR
jgi:hypothetical protein